MPITALELLGTAIAAILFAEFFGYVIHVTLHSQKIEYLSRNHMIHHLVVYGPTMSQRPEEKYLNSVGDRSAVLGIGMEWILPIGLVLALIIGTFEFMGLGRAFLATFTGTALGWGYFLFGYMHDNMHLKNFWMAHHKLTKNWFLHIRKLHDIHHLHVDDSGKMNCNYGICFFWFDRLFGSYKTKIQGIHRAGLEQAVKRYKFIFPREL